MKKKLMALMMAGALSVLAFTGCGDEEEYEEDNSPVSVQQDVQGNAQNEATGNVTGDSDGKGFSLLDVDAGMIEVGVYGADDNGRELVFSMFKGPDGEDYAALIEVDNGGESGDVICGTYDASTATDEDGYNWTYLSVSDVYTGNTFNLGVGEDAANNQIVFFNEKGEVMAGQYLDASQTITYMGVAAAFLQ